MPGGPMTRKEMKGEQKRTTTTKQNTSNNSYLVEEVTPQILSLGTKPFENGCFMSQMSQWVNETHSQYSNNLSIKPKP